jgi:hypothetical protein
MGQAIGFNPVPQELDVRTKSLSAGGPIFAKGGKMFCKLVSKLRMLGDTRICGLQKF